MSTESKKSPSDAPNDAAEVSEVPPATESEAPSSASVVAEVVAIDPLEEARNKITALKDQLMRTAADFDNFRKRSRREVEDARSAGREGMLKDLLPVFDNLERAMTAVESAVDVKSFANGVEMVNRQFQDTLTKIGIERVAAKGQPFDPGIHEAIQHLETTEIEPGHIAHEVQAGYRAGQRLIRPAMVVVAKAPPASAEEESSQDGAPEPGAE